MKAAINKITDGAKKRDTIGRNICLALNISDDTSANELIRMVLNAQQQYSSDNLEKVTNVIIFSGTNAYLLKYRAMNIANISPQAFATVREVNAEEGIKENEEGDDD